MKSKGQTEIRIDSKARDEDTKRSLKVRDEDKR
jgi:hypothetical protein